MLFFMLLSVHIYEDKEVDVALDLCLTLRTECIYSLTTYLKPCKKRACRQLRVRKQQRWLLNERRNDKTKESTIKRTDGVHVHSDKTGNMYKMDPAAYHNFILNTLTSDYRKTGVNTLNDINDEGLRIVTDLDISERTEPFEPKPPFFQWKITNRNSKTDPQLDLSVRPNPISEK